MILYSDILAVIFTVHPQSLSQSEVSCHSVSALSSIRKLLPGSVIQSRIVAELSHTLFDIFQICTQCRIQLCGSSSSQQFQLVFFDLVELSVTRTLPSPYSRVQQCRTPSTNCTKSSLVELHRRTSCRPIDAVFQSSTMSNSIDQLYEVQQCRTPSTTANLTMTPAVNNVEPHRQSHCMPSPAMSNSIDKSYRHNGASSQQCRTPSTIQDDPSCVQSWDSSRIQTRRIE